MLGARGDALEWALALAQAPSERHSLRQRCLPEGIESLLQIAAGGAHDAVGEAVARTGESAEDIVEAARFYLREVLFFQGADAYRMLGLDRDASNGQIKAHHRLLQQWLHPDRHTSDWDAIFASRVNAAWNLLRTQKNRAAYDAQYQAPDWKHTETETRWGGVYLHAKGHEALEDNAGDRWLRRAPVLALFAVCLVLGLLALLDSTSVGDSDPEGDQIATASPGDSATSFVLRVPEPRPPSTALRVPEPVSTRTTGAIQQVTGQKTVQTTSPVAYNQPSTVLSASRDQGLGMAKRDDVPPTKRPDADLERVASRGENARKTALDAAEVPVVRDSSVKERVPALASVSPAGAASGLAPARAQTVKVIPVEKAPSTAMSDQRVARLVQAARNSPERADQAQRTCDELLAYLSGRRKLPPPIWDHLGAQAQANRLRDEFGERRLRVGESNWQLDDDAAAMLAEVTSSTGNAHQLRVDLVWREQRWLVSGIALGGGS